MTTQYPAPPGYAPAAPAGAPGTGMVPYVQGPQGLAPAGQSLAAGSAPVGVGGGQLLPQPVRMTPVEIEAVPFPALYLYEGQRRTLCGYGACDPTMPRASNQFIAWQSSRVWIQSSVFAAGGNLVFPTSISARAFSYGVNGASGTSGDTLTRAGSSSTRQATLADTSALSDGTMAASKNCQYLIFGFNVTPESLFQYAADGSDFHPAWLSPKSFDYYERVVSALLRNLHLMAINDALGCRYQLRTAQEQPGLLGVRGADQLQVGQLTGYLTAPPPIAWLCSGSDVNNNQIFVDVTLPVQQTIENVAANPTVVGPFTAFTGVVFTLKVHAIGMTIGLQIDTICGPTLPI